MAPASGWRIAAGLLLAVALPAEVGAQVCPRVPAGLRCAPLPKDGWTRREALQALDAEGRRRVGRGDYPGAAQAFSCLVEGDPTPESAGNLAVVLREQGDLGSALLVARCAEELAPPGPARDRARARREEIEHRLGLPAAPPAGEVAREGHPDLSPLAAAAPAAAAAGAAVLSLPAPPPPARSYRRPAYVALGLGVAALLGGGIVYALARDRARQFDDEQQRSGYSERARTLRGDAQRLETAGWISFGAGLTAAAVGGVMLTF
jgi:hypothetical protein